MDTPTSTVSLLMHPVRLRIVHAMYGQPAMTTAELLDRLPDVAKASMYRHVAALTDAGIVTVVGQRRVRGATERRYRLEPARAVIDAGEVAAMTAEDHRRLFATAMAALLAEFDAYLNSGDADPTADQVSYRQFALWLTEDERAELVDQLRDAIVARAGNQPGPDRTRHLLSAILFPARPAGIADTGQ